MLDSEYLRCLLDKVAELGVTRFSSIQTIAIGEDEIDLQACIVDANMIVKDCFSSTMRAPTRVEEALNRRSSSVPIVTACSRRTKVCGVRDTDRGCVANSSVNLPPREAKHGEIFYGDRPVYGPTKWDGDSEVRSVCDC